MAWYVFSSDIFTSDKLIFISRVLSVKTTYDKFYINATCTGSPALTTGH